MKIQNLKFKIQNSNPPSPSPSPARGEGSKSPLERGAGVCSPPLRAYGSEPTAYRGGDEGEGDVCGFTNDRISKRGCRRQGRYFKGKMGGFTLIELVITMVLIGIVAYVVATAMATGFKAYFTTDFRKEALDQSRIAMERMTREIRNVRSSSSADLSVATATTFTFVDISGTPISFALSGGNINRTSGATNTLAIGISNATFPSGIFKYVLTDGITETQTPTAAQMLLIKRVKIDFQATKNNESVTLQSEVWPRSL